MVRRCLRILLVAAVRQRIRNDDLGGPLVDASSIVLHQGWMVCALARERLYDIAYPLRKLGQDLVCFGSRRRAVHSASLPRSYKTMSAIIGVNLTLSIRELRFRCTFRATFSPCAACPTLDDGAGVIASRQELRLTSVFSTSICGEKDALPESCASLKSKGPAG